MEMVFEFLAYVIHGIVIDLWVGAQLWVDNMYKNQPYSNLPLQRASKQVKAAVWVSVNLLFIGTLIALDLFSLTLAIIGVELVLIGVGALVIYAVIYSSDTWFEFIT
jgi:hypothetical protein